MTKNNDIDEYQKVAALVCMDIDIVLKTAEQNNDMALDLLRMLKEKKDNVVNDKKCRDSRYNAVSIVLNIGK